MTKKYVLKGATLADGSIRDILIDGDLIVEVAASIDFETSVDCSGLIALPGFVDLHTHLREPGFEASETVLTGSKAAAARKISDSRLILATSCKPTGKPAEVKPTGSDAAGFARKLQSAGYATDPNYATKLASIIKKTLA